MFQNLKHRYPILQEIRIRNNERKKFYAEAKRRFMEDCPEHGNLLDYKKCLYRHRFSYNEYMNRYELWKLSQSERETIMSQRELWCIYRKYVHNSIRNTFSDKVASLQLFHAFMGRKWIRVKDVTFEEFSQMLITMDCILKPVGGECGQGVFKVCRDDKRDLHELFELGIKQDLIVEECVHACDEIESLHPSSLNTIRVVTMSNPTKCVLLGAILRMGIGGHAIDNVSAGGIAASIDVETGIVRGPGVDATGAKYGIHPDTGVPIQGLQVPYWGNVRMMCEQASKVVPEACFTGWDIGVLPNGKIELIEVNSCPDMNGLQFAAGKGIKPTIQYVSKELTGMDLVSLISVWSRSYRNWN